MSYTGCAQTLDREFLPEFCIRVYHKLSYDEGEPAISDNAAPETGDSRFQLPSNIVYLVATPVVCLTWQ